MNQGYYKPKGFGGFSFFPSVIKNLLIINGVIFFIQVLGKAFYVTPGLTFENFLMQYFALQPVGGFVAGVTGYGAPLVWDFYPWQLITYQFMHGGFTHILFNMFALWMFGMEIENIWGPKKFLIFYLLCGVAAGLFHLILSPLIGAGGAPTIGASGAIYGVMIAFALFFPNRYIFLYFFIPVKAKYLIVFFILLDIFLVNGGGNVAHFAHVGGAVAGFLYIMLDKSSHVELKNLFRGRRAQSYSSKPPFNPFGGLGDKFKKKERSEVQDANFYIVNEEDEKITQEDIDRILDKISQSGYQNLTEKEKKILFEASKRMK